MTEHINQIKNFSTGLVDLLDGFSAEGGPFYGLLQADEILYYDRAIVKRPPLRLVIPYEDHVAPTFKSLQQAWILGGQHWRNVIVYANQKYAVLEDMVIQYQDHPLTGGVAAGTIAPFPIATEVVDGQLYSLNEDQWTPIDQISLTSSPQLTVPYRSLLATGAHREEAVDINKQGTEILFFSGPLQEVLVRSFTPGYFAGANETLYAVYEQNQLVGYARLTNTTQDSNSVATFRPVLGTDVPFHFQNIDISNESSLLSPRWARVAIAPVIEIDLQIDELYNDFMRIGDNYKYVTTSKSIIPSLNLGGGVVKKEDPKQGGISITFSQNKEIILTYDANKKLQLNLFFTSVTGSSTPTDKQTTIVIPPGLGEEGKWIRDCSKGLLLATNKALYLCTIADDGTAFTNVTKLSHRPPSNVKPVAVNSTVVYLEIGDRRLSCLRYEQFNPVAIVYELYNMSFLLDSDDHIISMSLYSHDSMDLIFLVTLRGKCFACRVNTTPDGAIVSLSISNLFTKYITYSITVAHGDDGDDLIYWLGSYKGQKFICNLDLSDMTTLYQKNFYPCLDFYTQIICQNLQDVEALKDSANKNRIVTKRRLIAQRQQDNEFYVYYETPVELDSKIGEPMQLGFFWADIGKIIMEPPSDSNGSWVPTFLITGVRLPLPFSETDLFNNGRHKIAVCQWANEDSITLTSPYIIDNYCIAIDFMFGLSYLQWFAIKNTPIMIASNDRRTNLIAEPVDALLPTTQMSWPSSTFNTIIGIPYNMQIATSPINTNKIIGNTVSSITITLQVSANNLPEITLSLLDQELGEIIVGGEKSGLDNETAHSFFHIRVSLAAHPTSFACLKMTSETTENMFITGIAYTITVGSM